MLTLETNLNSPLHGFISIPIDQDRFTEFKSAAYAAKIPYGFGKKDSHPGVFPPLGFAHPVNHPELPSEGIDCSGFMRTLLMYSSHNILSGFPDGSEVQAEWFKDYFHKTTTTINGQFKTHEINSDEDYNSLVVEPCSFGNPTNDPNSSYNLLRICFHLPNGRGDDSTGHVWAAIHGHTVESYGHHGPGERPINSSLLRSLCDLVVIIGPMVSADSFKSQS